MPELYQLYNDQGHPLSGQGALKEDVLAQGLLHAAAHVWIWRVRDNIVEVLLQKRASTMRTWPNYYDISAAGHISLGEEVEQSAIREVQEEIGLSITPNGLNFIGIQRAHLVTEHGDIENEFQWIYIVRLPFSNTDHSNNFTLQQGEVDSLSWKTLDDFKREALGPESKHIYVPHDRGYFETVVEAIEQAVSVNADT